ncbi:hypothetical protein ES707_12050 [subsurface metagenome]
MKLEELNPTQMAIVTLLRAPDVNGKENSPIPGLTHLVKEIFALTNTELGSELLDELCFEPDNFGPFDETVYAALDNLKDAGVVAIEPNNKRTTIKLTSKGKKIAEELWGKLKDDIVFLFSYTKMNYNHLSSDDLLDKIYAAYPEMTKYSISKVAEKYRTEGMS